MAERTVAYPGTVAVLDQIGASYRQVDYWVRQGWLLPQCPAGGSGSQREWPPGEVAVAARLARLVRAGIPPTLAARYARAGSGRHQLTDGVWLEVADG